MDDQGFQRLFKRPGPIDDAPKSLSAQAALGPVRQPRRSQFSWLVRLFLERFFNHETASPDGDAKVRLVQIAVATGLPPFIVAMYLWPIYHPWPPGPLSTGPYPGYWLQALHHFFFVLYSFVALGIATVFEWDLFFPDILDLTILTPLPIAPLRSFAARVASIAIFIAGFLFDANILAPFVLPLATDPPNLPRLVTAQIVATMAAGLWSAIFIVALNGTLLALFGERLFRRIALLLQCAIITALVMMMLFFPVLSSAVPALLQSNNPIVYWLPPFWFLGVYQQILGVPSDVSSTLTNASATTAIFHSLAQTAIAATVAIAAIAVITYPIAYLRKMSQLLVGPGTHKTTTRLFSPLNQLLHRTILRPPMRRAVFHFINQTLPRVPRYRIYLVLYAGVGLSVVASSILRVTTAHQHIRIAVSPEGIRVALAIVIFWIIAGLRMAFVSSGNQRGRWIFRIIHGNPAHLSAAIELSRATRTWVLLCTGLFTLAAFLSLRLISPPSLLTPAATASQALVAAAMCLLLTDAFFINVTTVPFTGESSREQPNLAFTVLKYFLFFPFISALPLRIEPWIESSSRHFAIAAIVFAAIHLLVRRRHQYNVRVESIQLALEEDEEDFPMKLGLKY
jgi:hypothetical protein